MYTQYFYKDRTDIRKLTNTNREQLFVEVNQICLPDSINCKALYYWEMDGPGGYNISFNDDPIYFPISLGRHVLTITAICGKEQCKKKCSFVVNTILPRRFLR